MVLTSALSVGTGEAFFMIFRAGVNLPPASGRQEEVASVLLRRG